jgi:ABC-type transporter Mla MlaB component
MTRCLPDEDFAVLAERRSADCRVLVARGPLTAAGGELLYRTISTACEQPDAAISTAREQADGQLVVDLTAVTAVEPAGWAWLLPALQECQAADRQLRILPPRVGITGAAPDRPTDTPARLRCYPDGPILVRGDFELVDRTGSDIPRTRSVVALCRCGNSAIKPFCDGSHKSTRFTDG